MFEAAAFWLQCLSITTNNDQAGITMNRRSFLHTTGIGSTAIALATVARAEAGEANSKSVPDGRTAFEFLGRSDQDGAQVTHYGYLTHIFGLADEQLFADLKVRTEATARFTFLAVTNLDSRHQHENIITTSAPGELTLFLKQNPGADFSDPASFARGKAVAAYSVRFHNVINVQAPDQGIAEGSVELTQLSANAFALGDRRLRLGQPGLRARLAANGSGTRTQVDPVRAFFLVGGHVVVIDS